VLTLFPALSSPTASFRPHRETNGGPFKPFFVSGTRELGDEGTRGRDEGTRGQTERNSGTDGTFPDERNRRRRDRLVLSLSH